MALSVKQGVLTASATASAQPVTGLGFQPKAIIFYGAPLTATGTGANAAEFLGIASSSSQMFAQAGFSTDAHTAALASRAQDNAVCITIIPVQAGAIRSATLTTFGADGFTITWQQTGTQYLVYWIALGGADLTNALAGSLTLNSGTGSQAVSGVGFKPDFLLTLYSGLTSLSTSTYHTWSMAAATATASKALGAYDADTANPTTVSSIQKTDMLAYTDDAGTMVVEAALTSFDTDGFTLNLTTAPGVTTKMGYLALKGGRYFVGTDTQKTSTGTQAKTGVGFTPKGLVFFSRGLAAGTTADTTSRKVSIGATDGTNQGAIWNQSTDNVSTSVAKQAIDSSNALIFESNPTPTLNAAAAISSLDAGGYTLNWGTADATAREFVVVAFGDTGSPPVNTVAPAVTGTDVVGQTLSTTTGTWTGDVSTGYTYQWQRDVAGNGSYSNIGSATASTYVLANADDGCNVRCVVTATGTGGAASANSNVVGTAVEPAPTNSVAPLVTGTTTVGAVLTTTNGTWANMGGLNPVFSYQWQRDVAGNSSYSNIGSATASTYTLVAADDTCHLRCIVTATNTGGTANATSNAASITYPAPVNNVAPVASGSVQVGQTVTVTTGTWTPA